MEKTLVNKDYLQSLLKEFKTLTISDEIKAKALAQINNQEIPTAKDELWRQAKLNMILEQEFAPTQNTRLEIEDFKNLNIISVDANTLVFYNGHFQSHLSEVNSNNDFTFSAVSEALNNSHYKENIEKTTVYTENIFASLATAYPQDGAFLHVQKNKKIEKPFHLILIDGEQNKNVLAQYNHLFVLENNAQAQLIISQVSRFEGSFENSATEVILGENAFFEQSYIQNRTNESFIINSVKTSQSASSNFKQNTFSLKSKFIRNNTTVDFNGENSETRLNGLYIPEGNEHFNNFLLVNHLAAHCDSNQVYKGIADDKSSAVFFGKVYVAKDAQKTNANQSNKNLLLSKFAKVNSKPQLEIYADDVACSHGSTTGQLDEEALFFMQTRGISKDSATRLLLFAFAADVLEDIQNIELKEYVDSLLHHRFDSKN